MSDVLSLAVRASSDGLEPLVIVKDVLTIQALALPPNVRDTRTLYSPDMGRAILNESFLYLFRSMSQLVAYEASYTKKQFSWAGVTLYYANFFAVLAMNRLAGSAVSTSSTGNKHYSVSPEAVQSSYSIERIEQNNHILIWKTNYDLFYTFNWIDASCDGVIVQVPQSGRNYYEKRRREYLNYHPTSYTELFKTRKGLRGMAAPHGRYYSHAPNSLPGLLFPDEWQRTIATLESYATARQVIVLTILEEAFTRLGVSSQRSVKSMVESFSKNIMTHSPFTSRLRPLYSELLARFIG